MRLVIWLLLLTPAEIGRPHIEMLQWIVLAAVLIWFSFMGGYVNHLHSRLKESEYDELTGIYTRRRILEVLEHEKIRCDRGAGPLCIGMLDIDRFKHVNDNFGHAAGDDVLRRSVDVAQKELRAIDFMGRYRRRGISARAHADRARRCARVRRARARADRAHRLQPARQESADDRVDRRRAVPARRIHARALERADAALYRAKAGGRNRIECE